MLCENNIPAVIMENLKSGDGLESESRTRVATILDMFLFCLHSAVLLETG